jgi:protein SCO1/2
MIKKYGKAGLLIVTLVIPALVFAFLRVFTTNHYNIPYFHPVKDAAGAVSIVNSDTVFYTLPEVGNYRFDGKLTVVSYMDASCEDSCTVMRDNLDRINGLKEGIKDLNLVLVTDTVAHISTNRWGDATPVIRLTTPQRDSLLMWNSLVAGKELVGGEYYRWMLIDKGGHIRGYYNGTSREETDRLMAELKILDLGEKRGLVK